MAELKTLIHQRGSIKGRITVFQKHLETAKLLIESKNFTDVLLGEFKMRLSRLQDMFSSFDDVQNNIDLLVPEKELDGQIKERDEIETLFCNLVSSAECLIGSVEEVASHRKNNAEDRPSSRCGEISRFSENCSVKLPTIKLPTFDGNHLKWLEYRDTFESLIHNNESITSISKFHYLRASLEGGASIVIKSINFTASNYELAWKILCDRFNNKRILANNHIRSLFNFECMTKESHKSIRYMVDYYSKNLRSLEELNEPVQFWDTLVIYIMSSKLDGATGRRWEEHRNSLELSPTLADFFEYLRNRANVLETLDNTKFDHSKSDKLQQRDMSKISKSFVSSTNLNTNSNKKGCLVCKNNHYLYECGKFKNMSLNTRLNLVSKNKLCTNCLRSGHHQSRCLLFARCKFCKKKHNSLLHQLSDNEESIEHSADYQKRDEQSGEEPLPSNSQISLSAVVPGQVLLCTAEVELIDPKNNKSYLAKALLDSGSQSSFLSEKMLKKMNLYTSKTNVPIYGINNSITNTLKVCDLRVKSRLNNFCLDVSCLVIAQITNILPSSEVDVSQITLPSNVQLADSSFFRPSEVHILLGADVFWDIVKPHHIKLGRNKPTLQDSTFGWLVAGPIGVTPNSSQGNKSSRIQCNFSQEIRDSLVKFWEIESFNSSVTNTLSNDEEYCEVHFNSNTKRLDDGRFCVQMPFCEEPELVLGDSFEIAKKRFMSLEKRLSKTGLKQDYANFIHEYEQLGHLNEIEKPKFGYYIPHHSVIRESSETTRLRVVFDASCRTYSGKSLNDIMLVGPVVQDDLFSILLRFRQNAYVVTGDVAKMYRQVLIDTSQRHLQLIIWRDDESLPLKILQLNTVTYGTASAPFLSTRCLLQLANECHDENISNVIKHDFYIDDLNTGSNSKAELKAIIKGVICKLSDGCFPLRKFRTNVPEIFEGFSIDEGSQEFSKDSTVLGLKWSPTQDCLHFNTTLESSSKVTKRLILSISCKIFDPLGILSAVTIIPKTILQKLWLLKLDWDDPVPCEIRAAWMDFVSSLNSLSTVEVPRHCLLELPSHIEIHCFSDASLSAYGACIYLRSINYSTNDIKVSLLCAKARVAPIKPEATIPRLELLGALLSARLHNKVIKSLRLNINRSVFWCDSTIVLGWLNAAPKTLKTFVCSRIEEIRTLTDQNSWRHIPTNLNPADLASRGVTPQFLKDSSLWWQGPIFLLSSEELWPCSNIVEKVLPETKICLLSEFNESIIPFDKFSSFNKLHKVFAYVLRFIKNCRIKNNKKLSIELTLDELNESLFTLARMSQLDCFSEDIKSLTLNKKVDHKSNILSLDPFIDKIGLLRVGGRIQEAEHCSFDQKHPILISSKHLFTKLYFTYIHTKFLHCGPQQLLSLVRDLYWPIGGRKLASKTVNDCFICKKLKAKSVQPLMGQLPKPRVTPSLPFSTCGTDFAGPFFITNRKGRGAISSKCYLCLFVCFFSKAVHLEVVSELSTNAFILTLRRFISRRGKPNIIYCDNGRNFVGANNELNRLLKSFNREVAEFACDEGIIFKFSPAYSPNFGGIWEAGVKAAKFHLKRIIGDARLTFEELTTLFCQIEAILNSRPLTPLSSNPSDLSPLTPGHFLIGRPLTSIPTPPVPETTNVNRYQLIERLRQHFWRRWSNEYLVDLQQRVKWRSRAKDVKPGQLVLIKDEALPPLKWLLGRIVKLYPGPDNITRVADVHTTKGTLRRALTNICVLFDDLETDAFKGPQDVNTTG